MSVKFTLVPEPTFKLNVSIPVAGKEDGVVTFTFRHKNLDELEALESKTVFEFVLAIVESWALADEFNRDNLMLLHKNYPSAVGAIFETYHRELMGVREKN